MKDIHTIILENANNINTFEDFIKIAGASGMEEIKENINYYTDEEVYKDYNENTYIIEYLKDSCFYCINEMHTKSLIIYSTLLNKLWNY